MLNLRRISGIVLLVGLLAACATTQALSPKQKATVWMNIYNAEYADTMAVMSNPNSTPSQREIGARKKEILTRVWPLIQVYVNIVESGGTPSEGLQNQLVFLINELTAAATGGK
jgi:hypothetical protein